MVPFSTSISGITGKKKLITQCFGFTQGKEKKKKKRENECNEDGLNRFKKLFGKKKEKKKIRNFFCPKSIGICLDQA